MNPFELLQTITALAGIGMILFLSACAKQDLRNML